MSRREVQILGVGATATPGAEAATHKPPLPPGMNARKARRLCRQTCLSLYASDLAWTRAGLESGDEAALLVGLTHGSTSFLKDFHDYLFDHGPEAASPNAFAGGVAGAPLATNSARLGLTLGGTTLVGYEACGLDLLNLAARKVLAGEAPRCLAGACEEFSPLVRDVYAAGGWYPEEAPPAHLPCPRQPADPPGGMPMAEAAAFAVLATEAGSTGGLLYQPLDDPLEATGEVDLILSCASGGPQDRQELGCLHQLLQGAANRPSIAFPKAATGETFAVGPLLALDLAWRILREGAAVPEYSLHPSLAPRVGPPGEISRVMLLATDREGQAEAGIVSMP